MDSRTRWFTEARFGMFIHYSLFSLLSTREWCRGTERYDDRDYHRLLDRFSADRWNPARWAELARRAGMKYSVMVSKHHEGFCLFDSQYTDFKSMRAPIARDLVRDYLDAFRREGIQAGLYYSLIDWDHPEYTIDRLHPHRNNADWNLPLGKNPEPWRDMAKYRKYMFAQVRELLTNYGKIPLMWFDFSFDEKGPEDWDSVNLLKMIRMLQPDLVLNSRLDRGHLIGKQSEFTGDFFTPEQFVPAEGFPVPWESCITINDNWGYNRNDSNFKSAQQIIRLLVECVSKGGNLLLNVAPTPRGDIQPEVVKILENVGEWMDLNGKSIHCCGHAGLPKPEWGYWTRNGDRLYAHVFSPPSGPLVLPGWKGKVDYATLLADGTNLDLSTPWMYAENPSNNFYLSLPSAPRVFDPIDTVIELKLKNGMEV